MTKDAYSALEPLIDRLHSHAESIDDNDIWDIAFQMAGVIAVARAPAAALVERATPERWTERDEASAFLERRGYRRCDIAACNCNSWHGGHAEQRLGEIEDALSEAGVEMNGKTIRMGVSEVLLQRDEALAAVADRATAPAPLEQLVKALTLARQFIVNGVEFGYIRMPTGEDSANDTLPAIDAALRSVPSGRETERNHD